MSAIYRTGERFGVMHIVDVLAGKVTEKVEKFGHDKLQVFGKGADIDGKTWQSVLRQISASGLVVVSGEHGGLSLSEEARPVLRGEQKVMLRRERPKTKSARRSKDTAEMSSGAVNIFDLLRAERAKLAKEQGVPPYLVFHDTTLRAMAESRPDTLDAMGALSGIGKAKLDRYGKHFLAIIARAA